MRTACLVLIALGWVMVRPASADHLILTPAGNAIAEEIERKIAPAPIESLMTGHRAFRCVIIAATPGDPDEPLTSVEGNPTYTIVPHAPGGDQVGAAVRISGLHVVPAVLHIDSLLDLRTYGSNRDKLLRTYIGSPAYLAGLRRALDPQDAHGIRSAGDAAGDDAGLEEGGLVLRLRTRVEDAPDFIMRWQREVKMPASHARHAKRLPVVTDPNQFFEVREQGQRLLDAIARAEKYQLYESGFTQGAMGILVARSELIRATGEGWYADALRDDGQGVHSMFLMYVRAAARGNPNPPGPQPDLPLDPSDRANVALDLLLLSNATYFLDPDRLGGVVESLILLAEDPEADDPRANDEHDLRAKAKQVLARLLGPGSGGDARLQEVRQGAVATMQQELQDEALTQAVDVRRFCFDTLSRIGWQATPATLERVRSECRHAIGSAAEVDRVGADEREEMLAIVARRVALLRDLKALASADRAGEREIGKTVVEWLERVRTGDMDPDAVRYVLAAWDEGGG